MNRHPDNVIVWLDVDAHGDLSPLADIRGAAAFRSTRSSDGTTSRAPWSSAQRRKSASSNWKRASARAPYGEIDQSSQVVAMAASIGTTFVPLPLIYCVNPDEKGRVPCVVAQHDSAAVHFPTGGDTLAG